MMCPHCQTAVNEDSRFCPQCGQPVRHAASPAKLVVTRGGRVGREFPLEGAEINAGRWDPDGGAFPEVDLSNDDHEAKVSRRHARFVCEDGQFYVEDVGSLNGTFLNRGARLVPGQRYPIHDGDEVIMGKTFVRFMAAVPGHGAG